MSENYLTELNQLIQVTENTKKSATSKTSPRT